jgi:1,4-dihydroxy-6-naphthoate synthase
MSRSITIYHSPDADDAFMFYGLACGAISYPGYEFKHELCDIQTLNQRAREGLLDMTAVSVHGFAYLENRYAIVSCGSSMGGKTYGPRIISREPLKLDPKGKKLRLAIPGPQTSATLALKLYLKEQGVEAELVPVFFEDIPRAVSSAEVDAGVIIHESQITFEREGLHLVADLGVWWWQKHELPLPLGVNIVNRALGEEAIRASSTVFKQSILYALANRKEALEYALSYGRGLSAEDADEFVGMYVNDYTIEMGTDGRRSIQLFLEEGFKNGFIPTLPDVQFFDTSLIALP